MDFKRNLRKWFALLCAVLIYYVIHEGAHLAYALSVGAFKQINFMGLGIQIDVYRERLADAQLGIFCLVGPIASLLTGLILVIVKEKILKIKSLVLKAIAYYTTLALLLIDPLYLSVVYRFVGGGDMNGIKLLIPELLGQIGFGIIMVLNIFFMIKFIFPSYKKAYLQSVME